MGGDLATAGHLRFPAHATPLCGRAGVDRGRDVASLAPRLRTEQLQSRIARPADENPTVGAHAHRAGLIGRDAQETRRPTVAAQLVDAASVTRRGKASNVPSGVRTRSKGISPVVCQITRVAPSASIR